MLAIIIANENINTAKNVDYLAISRRNGDYNGKFICKANRKIVNAERIRRVLDNLVESGLYEHYYGHNFKSGPKHYGRYKKTGLFNEIMELISPRPCKIYKEDDTVIKVRERRNYINAKGKASKKNTNLPFDNSIYRTQSIDYYKKKYRRLTSIIRPKN